MTAVFQAQAQPPHHLPSGLNKNKSSILIFLFLKWLVIFRQPAVAISSQRFVQSFFTRIFFNILPVI